jgi:hypothetical protein
MPQTGLTSNEERHLLRRPSGDEAMSNTGAVVAAIRMKAETEIVSHLRSAGATSPERSVPISPGRTTGRSVLRALVRQNVILKGRDGDGFWLDETRYGEVREGRRRTVLIVVAVLAVLAVVLVSGLRP